MNPFCSFRVFPTLSLCLFVSVPLCSGMKRPLSPPPPAEKELPVSGAAERPAQPPEAPRPKRERKRPSYTLCDVCNVQLNSAAQAQVHCEGRAHQRRLRQLSLGKAPAGPGQSGALGSGPLRGALGLWLLSGGPLGRGCLQWVLGSEVPQRLPSFVLHLGNPLGISQDLRVF